VEVAIKIVGSFETGRQPQQIVRAGRAIALIEGQCSMRLSMPPNDVARFHNELKQQQSRYQWTQHIFSGWMLE
jgi:hypothetical protein